MPATDTIDFEREFAELVHELRALPTAAPERVRDRVRGLGEPARRRALPRIPWRRSVLVLAPACALALVSAAVVHGVLSSGSSKQPLTLSSAAQHGESGAVLAPALGSPLVPPTPGRRQDYEASMTLRVKDLDALTDRTNEAMRVVRSYGGYVASVQQSTQSGQPGQADLEQALRQQRARIVRLKVFIARATEQLKTDLPADVRLRLQLQLQQAREEL